MMFSFLSSSCFTFIVFFPLLEFSLLIDAGHRARFAYPHLAGERNTYVAAPALKIWGLFSF